MSPGKRRAPDTAVSRNLDAARPSTVRFTSSRMRRIAECSKPRSKRWAVDLSIPNMNLYTFEHQR